jgi:alpha-galactosidase
VLVRPLKNDSAAVGLFNRSDQAGEISFRWDSIHLQEGHNQKSLHAVDLWKHEPVIVGGDSYTTTVPAHGIVLIKVSADRTK